MYQPGDNASRGGYWYMVTYVLTLYDMAAHSAHTFSPFNGNVGKPAVRN